MSDSGSPSTASRSARLPGSSVPVRWSRRMHSAAVGEGLAVDPAEDVAALLVDAEPPRRSVETGALQMQEDVAHQL